MYLNYTQPEQIKDVFKAVDDEDVENIRFYITDGADPDMRDSHGHTLLQHAMIKKKWHAAETLLDMGADPDLTVAITGQSALHYAASDDSVHMIGVLAAHKAKLDLADNFKWTPLHMATGRGKLEAVKALVELGADMSLRDEQNERTLDLATLRAAHTVETIRKPYPPIVDYLRAEIEERGIAFMSKEQRQAELASDIAALKNHDPNRFKLKM